eukprot:5994933-Lingulodinium_polyedra.AAC.1
MQPPTVTCTPADLDTTTEDLGLVQHAVGEILGLLNNHKGEVDHIRCNVLACEHEVEGFTAA